MIRTPSFSERLYALRVVTRRRYGPEYRLAKKVLRDATITRRKKSKDPSEKDIDQLYIEDLARAAMAGRTRRSRASFEKDLDYLLKKNAELYRRLAR